MGRHPAAANTEQVTWCSLCRGQMLVSTGPCWRGRRVDERRRLARPCCTEGIHSRYHPATGVMSFSLLS